MTIYKFELNRKYFIY